MNFLIMWFIFGFLAVILNLIYNFRGEAIDYIEDEVDGEFICDIIISLLLGVISFIIFLFHVTKSKGILSKMIYRISNIGLKNKKDE